MERAGTNDAYSRKGIRPVWCPGCGNYTVLKAVKTALARLAVRPEELVVVSGIGCSGRFSHYLDAYSLHGTHGRALPTGTGVKAARPELTVLVVGGDGDGLGIGGGHIAHAARKNVDMTYLLLDNQIYGLTKGQVSPTTPAGMVTKTTPYGSLEDAMEPIPVLLSYGVSFVARSSSLDVRELSDTITEAMRHPGFSIVYVMSPCVSFPFLDAKKLRARLSPLPDGHDPTDRAAALSAAYGSPEAAPEEGRRSPDGPDCLDGPLSSDGTFRTGVFYREVKSTLEQRVRAQMERAWTEETVDGRPESLERILRRYA